MRNMLVLATCVAAAACASAPPPITDHPKGYTEHMEAADAHSERAEQHRQAIHPPDSRGPSFATYQCGDTVMSDQVTSGGERLVQATPCWDPNEEHAVRNEAVADHEQKLADRERAKASAMVDAEDAACTGLSKRDLERSPFAHRSQIAAVVPHREGGTVRGVRVVFKPVAGLTEAWMRQAMACHRARFERLGEDAGYMPDDPSLIAKATTKVETRGNHLEVMIESRDDMFANVALQRAQDLVRPRTAVR